MFFWIDDFFRLEACHGYKLGENIDNFFDIEIKYYLETEGNVLFFRAMDFAVKEQILCNHPTLSIIDQIEKCVSLCLKIYGEEYEQ